MSESRVGIEIATRGSDLALWQARRVEALLQGADLDRSVRLRIVRTLGDRDQSQELAALGDTGVFTKEVDRELLAGRAQVAVHSLKDQETRLAEGLVLGLVLPRGPVEDVLIADAGTRLEELPPGARVATGSLRRRAQIARMRPDLEIVEIRGNVDSRLAKLDAGAADALILARAGVERLGLGARIAQILPVDSVLPAPAQGIVGVTCREDDGPLRAELAALSHDETFAAALAERAFLRELGGGCNVPVGALAELRGDDLFLRARIVSPDGLQLLEESAQGSRAQPEELGQELAQILVEKGGREIAGVQGG